MSGSCASRNITVAALMGVGSVFLYSLYKACSEHTYGDQEGQPNNKLIKHQKSDSTKGFNFSPLEIVEFWFGSIKAKYDVIDSKLQAKWFKGGQAFDNELRDKFGDFMKYVLEDKQFDNWRHTAIGCLALIIISDQMTRNVYRHSPKMFEYDPYALELCLHAIKNQFDVQLLQMHPSYLMFLYMPLMHSENLKHHQQCEEKYKWFGEQLEKDHPFREQFGVTLKALQSHTDIIRLCGRYPQRNDILGRKTTAKEKEIIKEHNLMELIDQSKQ